MQFIKQGAVVKFVSGFCALFAVAAMVALRRDRRKGKVRVRGRERRRKLAGKRALVNPDLYQRVDKPKEETRIKDNEIRITSQGRMRNYITYATTLLMEKGSNEVVLRAMGNAISKTVLIAELIKRRIIGLHQSTSIGSTDVTDTWEPLEEDLPPVETTRHVSMMTITLSMNKLDPFSTGYQPPLPADQVKQANKLEHREDFPNVRGGGPGRGGQGGRRPRGMNGGAEDYNGRGRGYGGRGRGRHRNGGSRGRGRGASRGPPGFYYPEAEITLAQGRGRRGVGRALSRGRAPARAAPGA